MTKKDSAQGCGSNRHLLVEGNVELDPASERYGIDSVDYRRIVQFIVSSAKSREGTLPFLLPE